MEQLEEALATGDVEASMRLGAGKYSRASFMEAEGCPAVVLMNHGRFEDLTFLGGALKDFSFGGFGQSLIKFISRLDLG